jgi:DNA polymerase-3 subunit epsilon
MSRSVLFDTETTGLEPLAGDRVIEVAALELVNDLPTGRHFHKLIDPERDIPEEATRVHGFSRAHLLGKPLFAAVVDELLAFFGDDPLVAHNAPFDFGFLNAELARLRRPSLHPGRMVDTLALAKARFPGMPNSLDALCRRFDIDLSERTTHNALLDCRLLAEVYVELTGGRRDRGAAAGELRTARPAHPPCGGADRGGAGRACGAAGTAEGAGLAFRLTPKPLVNFSLAESRRHGQGVGDDAAWSSAGARAPLSRFRPAGGTRARPRRVRRVPARQGGFPGGDDGAPGRRHAGRGG